MRPPVRLLRGPDLLTEDTPGSPTGPLQPSRGVAENVRRDAVCLATLYNRLGDMGYSRFRIARGPCGA